ncbi:Cytochrome c family protein [hydrothermal vent metagenome]|uniref:Cytochrome c family protein n=1 Tax=hydrothermal vent metagenome TaxID=652676 RepID=A0A3B0T4L6_9ZZZZ
MQSGIWRLAAVAIAVAGAAAYLFVVNQGPNLLFKPDDASVVAEGRRIYGEYCAACHGDNLEGQPDWQTPLENGRMPAPPHDKDGHTWHHSERLLFEITKWGVEKYIGNDYQSDMAAYEDILTDEEIIAVLSYIKSTWPAQTRERHDQISVKDAGS